jgi:capsular polysaccharide biosynthesis protein
LSKQSEIKQDNRTLDQLGVEAGLDQSSIKHGYLSVYEQVVKGLSTKDFRVVFIGNSGLVEKEAILFAGFYRHAEVVLIKIGVTGDSDYSKTIGVSIRYAKTIAESQVICAALGPIDIIIEHGTNKRSEKKALYEHMFLLVRPGGFYFIEDAHATFLQKFDDTNEQNVIARIYDVLQEKAMATAEKTDKKLLALAAGTNSLQTWGRLILVHRSSAEFLFKIRENYADLFFSNKPEPERPTVNKIFNSCAFETRVKAVSVPSQYQGRFASIIKIPELKWRVYSEVICSFGQVVLQSGCVLPESFRMSMHLGAENKNLESVDSFFSNPVPEGTTYLLGEYIHIDNEHPAHFGHITSEMLSKLWVWEEVQKENPTVKLLVSSLTGELNPVLKSLLELSSIPTSAVHVFTGQVRVERLVCPTQLYHISGYVAPQINQIWDRIAKRAFLDTPLNGKKIFMSRPPSTGRGCTNQIKVEEVFRKAGYEILLPEKFSIREQISIARTAVVLAGFAGSAMLSAIYGLDGQRKLVIGSQTFNPGNDYLISSVKGGMLYYFWCDAMYQHPKTGWSVHAFMSPYTFDFDRDGEALNQAIIALHLQ